MLISIEQGPRPLSPHHGLQLQNGKQTLVTQISTTKTYYFRHQLR